MSTPDPDAVERVTAYLDALDRHDAFASPKYDDMIHGFNHFLLRRSDLRALVEQARSPRPAEVSEEQLTTIIADTLDRLHVPESADRDGVEMDAEEIVRDLLPYLAPGQSEAEVRADELRRAAHDIIPDAYRDDPEMCPTILDPWDVAEWLNQRAARTAPAEDGAE